MKNYSKVRLIKSFLPICILLLSVFTMVMISGCGNGGISGNPKYSISGTVKWGGAPLPGATVTLSGDASKKTLTDASGHYSFQDVEEGEYRVAPSFEDYKFSPTDSKVYLFGMDATGFGFSVIDQGRIVAATQTVYLKSDGTVWAWGANGSGQLGDGTTTDSPMPVQVAGLSGVTVTAIAAGEFHTVALASDGTVWAWGSNSNGQLGDGTTTDSPMPVQVTGLSGVTVTAIAAGEFHTVALASDGTVWAWGSNSNGQLGDGTTTDSPTPVQASDLTDATAIAAGSAYTVALKSDRTVWTWGANDRGQLGHGGTSQKTKPTQVGSLSDVIAIAAGSAHTLALKKDGTVRAWGDNDNGQLGNGNTNEKKSPVDVKKLSDVIAIAAGEFHTVALKSDGTIWTFGSNSSGQLGDGTTTDASLPVEVSGLSEAIAITAGQQHTVAIKNDSTIWAWGSNSKGQLGDGTTTDSAIPVQVPPF
jgi:alpha-tubulin suppressor-like RCC1 family protein